MEINKNVGFSFEPSFHSHSPSKATTTRQNVTLRRRCRSECLQMTPIIGTAIEFSNELNDNKHYNKLNRSYFMKQNSPPITDNKRIHSAIEKRVNGISKDHIKENISSPSHYLDSSPRSIEITDVRDTYVRDMEMYKERLKSYNTINNGKIEKNLGGEIIFNVSDKQNETNKRRVRTRSESEPHEIYNTKYNQLNDSDREHGDDVGLKRARDDTTFNKNSNTNGFMNHENSVKATSPTPILNHHHTEIVNNHLAKTCSKYTKTNILNGIIRSKNKRSPTPTFKVNSSSRTTPPRKKSVTPPPASSSVASPAGTRNSECRNEDSDAECSSLEDDDDFGDIGEGNDIDITDDEDTPQPSESIAISCENIVNSNIILDSVQGRYSTSAPLSPSLFPNCPPYITFASHLDKGPDMPECVKKVLKWKSTTITPIVVRRVLVNSGFKLLKKTNDWVGIWGKHMKSPCFKTIRTYQKINHIPGTFQIGRKDRIWRNLQIQMGRHGKKEFNFMPRTYIIPHDLKLLRQAWPKYQQRNTKWIIKPPAAARGTGIKVVNRWSQIPKKRPLIVQKYIERPLLINGSKFDLRLYVLVTSVSPLRVYMHTDGLARFASVKYSEKSDTLSDRYMHLTNYSINKLSSNYAKNEDANACKGHKWTIKSLWTYLAAQGVNTNRLWGALRNLVLRTILAGEGPIYAMSKLNTNSKYNTYELFGIDVILDSELIPWLLEVNISPSLHSASPLDMHVKGPLVQALLNTALYQIPPKLTNLEQIDVLTEQGLKGPLCYDKRIFSTQLSEVEKIKHNFYANKSMINREDYLTTILDTLTPDDVRCLIISEDELARCAPLERIFPAPNTHKYLTFTENPRYYNRLLDAWENRFGGKLRDDGIKYLRNLCEMDTHLIVPPSSLRKDSSIDVDTSDDPNSISETTAGKDDANETTKTTSATATTTATTALKDASDINGIRTIEVIDDVAVIQAQ